MLSHGKCGLMVNRSGAAEAAGPPDSISANLQSDAEISPESKDRGDSRAFHRLIRSGGALAHVVRTYQHDVAFRLIAFRCKFEEDDASVAGIVELLQDETELIFSLAARHDHATDIP